MSINCDFYRQRVVANQQAVGLLRLPISGGNKNSNIAYLFLSGCPPAAAPPTACHSSKRPSFPFRVRSLPQARVFNEIAGSCDNSWSETIIVGPLPPIHLGDRRRRRREWLWRPQQVIYYERYNKYTQLSFHSSRHFNMSFPGIGQIRSFIHRWAEWE